MSDLKLERQYAQIHQRLIALIDDITFKNIHDSVVDVDKEFDALVNELDPIIFTHMDKPQLERGDIIRLNQFLSCLVQIKNLVYEQTLITLPILKSVNEAINMTEFEKSLKVKVLQRDQLSVESLEMMQRYNEITEEIGQLRDKLIFLFSETNLNLLVLSSTSATAPELEKLSDNDKKVLKRLKKLKQRTSILSEFLLSLIGSLNRNWSDDQVLKKMVLYCGTIDIADTGELQNVLDGISDDAEESGESDLE